MKGLWFRMHYSTRRRVALGLTTGGLLVTGLGMATAQAEADATAVGDAAGSPGVASGNTLQIPINLPVNVCGNQVNVIGLLNSVTGNSCTNGGSRDSSAPGSQAPGSQAPGSQAPGSQAQGSSHGSPGVGSGNLIQVPVNAPVNVCGNQLDVVGIGDSDHGNSCANHGAGGAAAAGSASHSPGIGSGNVVQVPVNAPVNVCGNQIDVIGLLNSVTANSCANGGPGGPFLPPIPVPGSTPPSGSTPPPPADTPPPVTPGAPTIPSPPCPPSGSTAPPSHGHHHGSSTMQVSRHLGTDTGSGSGSSGGASGGMLAHTGTSALAFAPFGAGLLSGGVLLKRRLPSRHR